MLDKFWEKIGENLAGDWDVRIFTLAFIFWGSGLAFYGLKNGWDIIQNFFLDIGTKPVWAGALLVGVLIVVLASNKVVEWVTFPFLRFLEGYWWNSLRNWASSGELKRRGKLKDRYYELDQKKREHPTLMTDSEEREQALVEYDLRYKFPTDEYVMPTPIGNVLRSAEEYPFLTYGLETTITWPHLWLVMPESTRQEIGAARQQLDGSVQLILWGLLFCIWTSFSWWALPIGVILILVALMKAYQDAFTFGLLVRTAYDLYRFELYKSLHWVLPGDSDQACEKAEGVALTEHLYRHNVKKYYIHP
jgi:hypothetical protein